MLLPAAINMFGFIQKQKDCLLMFWEMGVPKNWMPTYCCFMIIIKFHIWNFDSMAAWNLPTAVGLRQAVMFMYSGWNSRCLACICEVPNLNLCLITESPEVFVWLSLVPHDKFWVVPHVRPQLLPSTLFIAHYLLAVL
jgi:hypothetical protein